MENIIAVNKLHKSFGANKVLRGVDLNITTSGIIAVLGPNGSGKTTLIKSILGMVLPNAGEIRVLGNNTKGEWKYKTDITYLPQIARFPENLSVSELISMIKDLRGQQANTEPLIEKFGLEGFLNQKLVNLSGGTKQKVNLVLTFMYDTPIVILDEPTTGLDPVALLSLKKMIQEMKKQGKTILITSHIMQFVEEVADDIIFLLEGVIHFRGSVGSLKEKYQANNIEQSIAKMLIDSEQHVKQASN